MFDIYGLTEILSPGVACECGIHDGLHVCEEHFYPEVVGIESEECCAEGEVEMCIRDRLLVFKDSINEFRIDYLKKQDYEVSCGESFKLLQSKSAVLRNMILKGNIAGYRDKESIVNFISETRQADKVFCDLIIKDLRG